MRRNFLRALATVLPALMFCSGSARGDEASSYYAGSSEGRYLSVADSKTVTNDAAAENSGCGCTSCCDDDCCDDCCDDLDAFCDDCPRSTSIWFTNFESWRGRPDGTYQNNDGIRSGFNYGALAGDSRVGFQAGGSYGAYDFMGRSPGFENDSVQEQLFFTTGLFVHADCDSPWSAGLVYDMMVNDNFSVFSNEPYLTQWRGQIGYATSAWNEFGVWGTARDRGDSQTIAGTAIRYRAVQQYNFFWHHKWPSCVDSYIWTGVLDTSDDLSAGNGLGEFTIGGAIIAPISDSWAITGDLQYLKPSASAGAGGPAENSFFVSFGLSYYPRCNARTRTVAGGCSHPLLGVANNGSFLVDSNLSL